MLFEMNRVLMCRNHPVLEFAYSSNAGLILEVGDVFDPSRVPVGMYVDGQPRPDSDSVTAWWRSRGIPATRDGLRTLLMATGIPSGKELLDRSMGLSLSDQYWVRPAGMDALRWEDLNFFHNDFDERLGKALFTGDSSRIGDVNTPDVTSAGDLPKRWIIRDDGVRTLIKAGRSGQEPDNERIAWKTARLLGIDHVEYRVGKINGARVSACDEMLSDTEELIPAGQIMRIFRKGGYRERRDIWVEACQRLGVDRDTIMHATDDFLFLDFLLRNTDRHYNNFGLIRTWNPSPSVPPRSTTAERACGTAWIPTPWTTGTTGRNRSGPTNGERRTTRTGNCPSSTIGTGTISVFWTTCPTSSTNSFPPTSASPPCSSTGSRACCVAGSRSSDIKGTSPRPT